MKPPVIKWGRDCLFPEYDIAGPDACPIARKAALLFAMARANLPRLWEIDRAAAALLQEASHVPLWGRCPLENARFKLLAKYEPAHFLNQLAQCAQRRWKAFGLTVTRLTGSPALDLIGDDQWLTLPLAPELAALAAQLRPPHGHA